MYELRASERQSGWMTIATFETLEEAKEEFKNQIENDVKEEITDLRTEIIDNNGKIVIFHEGKNY